MLLGAPIISCTGAPKCAATVKTQSGALRIQKLNAIPVFTPVTNPALVAHWPLAVAAVDVQRRGRLVQAGDGAARAQLDDLV